MNHAKAIVFGLLVSAALCFATSCGKVSVPAENVDVSEDLPVLIPDYVNIVVPPNIAPLNFEIDMPGDEYVVRVSNQKGKSLLASGSLIQWDVDDWHALLEESKGMNIDYEVYVLKGDRWNLYKFANKVAEEDIDPYISYRLIEPSYVHFSGITLNQRNLTNFDEEVIWNTPNPCDERRGYCINCHVPRNQYRDRSSLFHVRGSNGGTIVMTDGKIEKVDLKTDSTLSAGVYPAWHPTLDLIAFSTNDTFQKFPDAGSQKVEVLDKASDLVLYDVSRHEVRHISNAPDLLETFPGWSPDGKRLYYSVARYPEGATTDNISNFSDSIRYDIVSRRFDASSMSFSAPDTLVFASQEGRSALLPRISPDGKFLLYCKAPFGTFHIWHKESDLYVMDLDEGVEKPLARANSQDVDSYHSWSSNSRWIVFSSRRDDGSYTRPYITYLDKYGNDSKAFVVPQQSPDYYRQLMKSYNVPEFMVEGFTPGRKDIATLIRDASQPVEFK